MDRRRGSVSDEELLTRLSASFPVEQIEPDASSLLQLSVAVAELRRPAATESAQITPRRTGRISLPRRLSPVVTVGSLVGALAMGTGISYAVGVPIPAAVRSVARTVGLAAPAPTPATLSPAVIAASQAESTLHQALANGNTSSAAISRDTSELAHRLARVAGDHAPAAQRVSDEGHHLLKEACPRLQGSSPAGNGTHPAGDATGTQGGATAVPTANPCAFLGGRGTSGASGTSPDGAAGGLPTGTGATTPSGGHGDGSGVTHPAGGSTPGGPLGGTSSGKRTGTSVSGSGSSGSKSGSSDHAAGARTPSGRPDTTSTRPPSTGSLPDGSTASSGSSSTRGG